MNEERKKSETRMKGDKDEETMGGMGTLLQWIDEKKRRILERDIQKKAVIENGQKAQCVRQKDKVTLISILSTTLINIVKLN